MLRPRILYPDHRWPIGDLGEQAKSKPVREVLIRLIAKDPCKKIGVFGLTTDPRFGPVQTELPDFFQLTSVGLNRVVAESYAA